MYALAFAPLVINDSPDRLNYHVESGDFLSYLATRVGVLEEFLARCDGAATDQARELRHDLRYVQAHYKVTPRSGDDIQTIRPSGNVLPE
jgi:hypothetical protein